jgi:(R,R)-butanediol dehydrogenase/meso-butanediol dehydrogenase/diacetyl reductase
MWAADFVDPGTIRARADASQPDPMAGEVIVRVIACGICGSDMHMFRSGTYRDKLVRHTPEGYQVPGHEFAGTIAAIGLGVEGWSKNQRVVGITGQGGGMADYVAVPVNPYQLVAIPDSVSFEDAATTEPLADGLQMIRKAAIRASENIVVFGVGIIGLGVIQAIRACGLDVRALIAVDVQPTRLGAALKAGATHVVNVGEGDVFDQISAITGIEQGYSGTSARIGVVFDCAGYMSHMPGPAPLETALRLIDLADGRIVCFGGFEDRVTLELSPLIQKAPTILGSNGYAPEELGQALALMASGKVDRNSLISHRFPLTEVAAAFAAQGGPQALKVMLTMKMPE